MQVEVQEDRGVSVLTVIGDALDASNAQRFRTLTEPHLGAGRHILDLGNLKFVDSSGIGALLSCLRKASAAGGELRLSGLQANVASLFQLVRMDRLFEIFPTVGEAVDSYAA